MKKVRIAIVDDDRDFAESMADVFEFKGHTCELFLSGEEAVREILEQDFDIVFMDVKLPGKNGVECLLQIRDNKPGLKVIMMTGFGLEGLLNEAIQNGASGVLHKPLDIDSVIRLIAQIHPEKVLIADDDPDFVNNLEEILEEAGFSVIKADNGRKVLEKVRKGDVDILILDLRMPVLNGFDTFLALHNEGHSIPTFIVTAFAKEETGTLDMLQSLSVTGILTKPFDPECLLDGIRNLTGETERR
ncbi:MAG: response regulator [Deltaproteobacteria bacterium]|nr:response regulator [Deltaproteobacteria bacterium]